MNPTSTAMNKILLVACALAGMFCALMAAWYLTFPEADYARQVSEAQARQQEAAETVALQAEQARQEVEQTRAAHTAATEQLAQLQAQQEAKEAEREALQERMTQLQNLPQEIEALRQTYGEKIRLLEEKVQAGETDIRICYLTFDDGPNNLTAPILEKLAEHDVYATFFTIGANSAQNQRENLRAEMMAGHTVANHSYSHAISWGLYDGMEEFTSQVLAQDEKVYEATGFHMSLFRFPSGSSMCPFLEEAEAWLAENGYKWIDWNASGWDSGLHSLDVGGEVIARNVKSNCKDLDIAVVLLHDFNFSTYEALDIFIPELKEQGFVFLPLSPRATCWTNPSPLYKKKAAGFPAAFLRGKGFLRYQDLQLDIWLQIGYNHTCPRETNTYKEVWPMFFFNCNSACDTDCSSIWQILSRLCGFGC